MRKALSTLYVLLLVFLCAVFPSQALEAAAIQDWAPEGVDIGGSRTPMPMPPDQLKTFIGTEITKWARIVKDANIQPE